MQFADGRLLAEQDGQTGWITFNQPERLNAVRRDMWDALPEAVSGLLAAGVRAIVLKGAGDKAFISGADIAEFDVQRNNSTSNRPFTASVSRATASLIEATARQLTAQEAASAGLVNSVVAPDKLEQIVREMAAAIATTAPLTYAAAKLASRAASDPSLREAAQQAIDRCFDSADFAEGRAAFHARRVPAFKGQ